MRNKRFTLLSLIVVAIFSFQFIPVNEQLFDTNLRITIQDDLGNVQQDAIVTLFANNDDYRASENPIAGPAVTDKKGRVTFKDLEAKAYYVHAEKGKMNNNMLGVKTDTLEASKLNKIAIVIQ